MSNPTTERFHTLEIWRQNLNSIGANVGDPVNLYYTDGSDTFVHPLTNILIAAINDLNTRKVKKSGDTISSLTITSGLTISGATASSGGLTIAGATQLAGLTIGANKVTVDATTGNLTSAGLLSGASLNISGSAVIIGNVSANNSAVTGTTSLGAVSDISVVTFTTTTTTANQVIGSFSATLYRSAEFIIQAVDATGLKYHAATVKVVHDGTAVSIAQYAAANTANGVCGTFSADISGGLLRLLTTPASINTTLFKATCILTKI